MVQEIEAVYENGVLRPLTPIKFGESETVHVRISTNAEESTLAVVLSVIPGNWSDDIIAERGEY